MTYQSNIFKEILALQAPITYNVNKFQPVSLHIISDISYESIEPIEGYIDNIDFYIEKGTPFEPNCFETFAFNDSGIWTSIKLFETPDLSGPLFNDCFEPGCWGNFSHQALETRYENGQLVQYPIDIGYSPIINNPNPFPLYTPSPLWTIEQEFIISKTFSIYNTITSTTYLLGSGTTYTSPNTSLDYELLLDLDSFLRTNIESDSLSDSCVLCIYVNIRNKNTQKIIPLLVLGTTDDLPNLYSISVPLITNSSIWLELGRLAAQDFLMYVKSIGQVRNFTGTPVPYINYYSYFQPRFVTNRDNRNAYLDHSNELKYWACGAKDKDGNVYLVDIGIFPECSDIPYIVDKNIPVGSDGRFFSRNPFPPGNKYIQVRKITPIKETLIYTYAPHTKSLLKTLNDNNPLTPSLEESFGLKDVKVNLEHLSITLLLLTISNYVNINLCEHIHNPPFIGPEVVNLIRSNFTTLIDLLAPYRLPYGRTHSIPLNLKPVTCKESIYEDAYRNGIYLMGWTDNMWTPGCFEKCLYLTPINREVSSRAMGWLCYSLGVYRHAINSSEFQEFLVQVSDYIINNIHPIMHLVSNGWTDTNIYKESLQIDEYDMSTSCVCCLALIKSYEQTGMYKYLEASVDIYNGILKYLMLPEEGVCADNMTDDTISTETLIYSLWFFTEMGRADIVERLVSLLNTRAHNGSPLLSASLYQSLPGLGEVTYNGMDLVGAIELNPLMYPYSLLNLDVQPYEKTQNVTSIIPQLLLLHGVSNLLPQESYVSIVDIPNTIEPIDGIKTLINEGVTTSLYLALELNKTSAFLNHQFVRIESIHLINSLIGYRNQSFSNVRAGIPIEFGWFHQKALTLSGTAGKLIWMLIRGVSSLIVNKNRISESKDKLSAIGINFDQIIQDFNLYRQPGEDKYTFFNQYIAYKTRGHNTTESIINLISLLGFPARLMESPVAIYEQLNTFNTYQPEFTSILEEGIMNPFNKVHIVSSIPPSPDFIKAVDISTPIGININFITHLAFPYFNQCLPDLTVDMFILKNYTTNLPTINLVSIIVGQPNSIFVSQCFNVIRVELSGFYANSLYIDYNPNLNPSIYLSESPTPYTISIIEPGLLFKIVYIPRE
jgi:hypothetical protein